MSKIFYDHLIPLDELVSELDRHSVPAEEREELILLIDQSLHHHTLNIILNHLPKSLHQDFLDLFKTNPANPELMAFLKKEIKADIESAIKTQADRVKKEILLDIKRSRRK